MTSLKTSPSSLPPHAHNSQPKGRETSWSWQAAKRAVFIVLLFLPALSIQFAAHSAIITNVSTSIQAHLPLYTCSLIIMKAVSIIYPPLPGIVFTTASIPLIGWQLAYVADIVGSCLGASTAFFLGKKYGFAILHRVIGKTIAQKIAKIKLKQRNQVEAALFLRFAAGGMLSDGLAWGASLIGLHYIPFMIGYVVTHLITTLPIFYFIAASISFDSWVLIAAMTIVAWIVIYKCKGRYFE